MGSNIPLSIPEHTQNTSVVLRGWCQGQGFRVGFGVCEGKVLPAGSDPVAVRFACSRACMHAYMDAWVDRWVHACMHACIA